jgi:hypothetical protein
MAIWSILRLLEYFWPSGKVDDNLVYIISILVCFTMKNLATLPSAMVSKTSKSVPLPLMIGKKMKLASFICPAWCASATHDYRRVLSSGDTETKGVGGFGGHEKCITIFQLIVCLKQASFSPSKLPKQTTRLIETRVARFFLVHDTKTGKMYQMNTNDHKCTKWLCNIPNVSKILQMSIQYLNIFQSKALKNSPKSGFLVRKETIWQP